MDRRALIIAAVAVGVVMLLVAFAGDSGLPDSAVDIARSEISAFERAEGDVRDTKNEVLSLVKDDVALFPGALYTQVWPEKLDAAVAHFAAATAARDKAQSLLKEDQGESLGQLEQELQKLRDARSAAVAQATAIQREARQRVAYKNRRADLLKELPGIEQVLASVNLEHIQGVVEEAGLDWPEKKTEVERRFTQLQRSLTEGAAAIKSLKASADQKVGDVDWNRFIADAQALTIAHDTAKQNAGTRGAFVHLIDQLYTSWDLILVDMEIVEGAEVLFYHHLKRITTQMPRIAGSNAVDDPESTVQPEEVTLPRKQVSKQVFEDNKNNLGMVLEHKPGGAFDHEVEKSAQPPGYAYMCTPEQKRNNYGYWSHGSSGSFWVWYGQYSLMRNLLWGPSYAPIYVNDYRGYRGARDYGRTYYGATKEGQSRYGTNSSTTKSRYSGSRYVRTGGYKTSNYVRSGGTYRGTRYATRRSGGSSSSRGSSFGGSRSGSRFGGGK